MMGRLGRFNGINKGDTVAIAIRAEVTDRGKDKNGVFLQTADNRFYDDQDTITDIWVEEYAPKPARPAPYPDGTVLRFVSGCDVGEAAIRIAWGDGLYNPRGRHSNVNPPAPGLSNYEVIYKPEESK